MGNVTTGALKLAMRSVNSMPNKFKIISGSIDCDVMYLYLSLSLYVYTVCTTVLFKIYVMLLKEVF